MTWIDNFILPVAIVIVIAIAVPISVYVVAKVAAYGWLMGRKRFREDQKARERNGDT